MGQSAFLDKSPDGSVSLHSWYRDTINNVFLEAGKTTMNTSSGEDLADEVVKIAKSLRGSGNLGTRLKDTYMSEIAEIVRSNSDNPAMKFLDPKVSDFIMHLRSSADLEDIADAVMLSAMIHLIDSQVTKRDSRGYGFNILKEKVTYKSLEFEKVGFYTRLIGFIVNGFITDQAIQGEQQNRPLYSLSILLFSRVFDQDFTDRIANEFLENGWRNSSENYSTSGWLDYLTYSAMNVFSNSVLNTQHPLKRYIAALSATLEEVGFLKADTSYERAELFYCKLLFEKAVKEFNTAIEQDNKKPDYHNKKGNVLDELGRFQEAIYEFDLAIGQNPDESDYHNNKGVVLDDSGRLQEAILEYDIAIGQNYAKPHYHYNKGYTLHEFGRYSDAIREFDIAIGQDCKDPDYHYNRALGLVELGNQLGAIGDYEIAIQLDPNEPDYHINKGIALNALGRYPDAISECDIAIGRNPKNPDYYYRKGKVLHDMMKFADAVHDFDRAISLDPNNPRYHYNKGINLKELSKYEEAISELEIARRLASQDVDILLPLIYSYCMVGRPALGKERASEAVGRGLIDRGILCSAAARFLDEKLPEVVTVVIREILVEFGSPSS